MRRIPLRDAELSVNHDNSVDLVVEGLPAVSLKGPSTTKSPTNNFAYAMLQFHKRNPNI